MIKKSFNPKKTPHFLQSGVFVGNFKCYSKKKWLRDIESVMNLVLDAEGSTFFYVAINVPGAKIIALITRGYPCNKNNQR